MLSKDQTDYHLLLPAIAAGDEQAFRSLFNTWSSRLFHFSLQLTGSKELAEDIVQDSFLKIWLRRDRLHEIENFPAYLFKMAQNAVTDGLRRRATMTTFPETEAESPVPDLTPDASLHIKLVRNVLEQAIKKLPPQQEKVWRLRREYGRRIKEISDEMGISETTVKQHLNRAQAHLRSVFLKEFPLEGGILFVIFNI